MCKCMPMYARLSLSLSLLSFPVLLPLPPLAHPPAAPIAHAIQNNCGDEAQKNEKYIAVK